MLSEMSYTEKEKYHLHLTYMWNLKTTTTKPNSQTQRTDWRLPEVGGGGWVGKGQNGLRRSPSTKFQLQKSWGCNTQHGDYS